MYVFFVQGCKAYLLLSKYNKKWIILIGHTFVGCEVIKCIGSFLGILEVMFTLVGFIGG